MSEILSQSRIDSLLNSLPSGIKGTEEPNNNVGKKIKNYDFRAPKLFTREQLKLLHSIYENYARVLTSRITGILQTYILVEIEEVEEQRYYEFDNGLPDSVLMGILDFELKDDNMDEDLVLMNFSKDIGFCTIDRLLGGLGKPLKEDREYTEIEMGLLEHIIKEIVSLMKNVWANYIEMAPKLVKLETNSRILQGISADENIVIVGMSILINETQGKIRICIPEATLDAIFKKRNAQNKKNARRGDQVSETQRRADIIKEISKSEFELTGVLGKVEILSKDLIDLEVGDIIKLKNAENSLVEISVGNVPWFRGELGSFNKKRAISIKESVEKGSEPV